MAMTGLDNPLARYERARERRAERESFTPPDKPIVRVQGGVRLTDGCRCSACRRRRQLARAQAALLEPTPKAVSRSAAQLLAVTRERMSTVAKQY